MKNFNLGVIYLMAVPLGAALVHFADIEVGGFRLAGWVWIVYFLAALVLVMAEFALNPQPRICFPIGVWIGWVAYLWITLVWCDGVGRRNVQDAMQITVPLLVAVLASMVVRTPEQLSQFMMAIAAALGVLVFRVALIRVGVIPDDLHNGSRIFSITALFMGGVGLAYASEYPAVGYLAWILCLAVTGGTGSRTTTGALLVLPILNPLHRNIAWRLCLAGGMVLAGIAIFYSPQFQQRFFYQGHGTLTQVFRGEFLSFGRFEAWPHIFAEALKHPWFGAGVGEVVEFVPTVWPEEDKPHNDYLRIFYEAGLVGFVLFWGTMIWQYRDICRQLKTTTGLVKIGYGASILGICGFGILCLTDNVLIYNLYYNNLLFGLLGATYGVARTVANAPAQADHVPTAARTGLHSKLFPPRSAQHPLTA